MIRASNSDDIGDDVVMREDSADEDRAEHPILSGSDSKREEFTTKREPREVRDERPSTNEQHVPKRILGMTTPREQAVAVTTQEALDGSREKTMRIENVENSALNWVSISSAGALDMTHCDFSVKSARDEMRHIFGSSEPDVTIGSDRDQNREVQKEGHEAQAACGRHFVHDLTSEVNSRTQCMPKVMATPGTRTAVADLCMFGLAACDEGGPGFVNVSVLTITNARRVGLRLQSKCWSMHRCPGQCGKNIREGGTNRIMVHQVAQAMEDQLKEDQRGAGVAGTSEDAKRI